MRLFFPLLLLSGTLALLVTNATSARPTGSDVATERTLPIVVTTDWLRDHARMPDVLIIDARSPRDYARGHLPRAINLPVDLTFSDMHSHRLLGLRNIRTVLRKSGLRNSDRVVIYDNGQLKDAARLFWVLETYGHTQVGILDGGLPAWLRDGHTQSYAPVIRAPSNYVPSVMPHRLATRLTTRLAISDPDVVIIDARASEEYRGMRTQARRAGHIPGAISLPWEANLTYDGGSPHLLTDKELRHLYQHLQGKRIITYCNRGKESAVTYALLRHLGYPVSVYDGSWLDWGNDPRLPISPGD